MNTRSKNDYSLFMRLDYTGSLDASVYVDDLLLMSTNDSAIISLKASLYS